MRWVEVYGKLCPSVTTLAGWLVPPLFGKHPYEEVSARMWYDRGWCDGQLGTPSQKPGYHSAAARGTAVHKAIECWINGEGPMPTGKAQKACEAVTYLRNRGWDVKAEVKVACLGGRVGGTADLVAVHRESRVIKIIDWKTGGFYPTYPLQLELLKTAFFPAAAFPPDFKAWTMEASDYVLGKPWGDESTLRVPIGGLKLAWDVAGGAIPPKDAEAAYKVSEVEMIELFRWIENG